MEPSGASARAASLEDANGDPRGDGASPLFSLRGVSQARGGVVILRDLTLDLPRTAITALVGPSGAGKTSLLRLLNRLDDPAAGEVLFDRQPIKTSSARTRRCPSAAIRASSSVRSSAQLRLPQ